MSLAITVCAVFQLWQSAVSTKQKKKKKRKKKKKKKEAYSIKLTGII